MFGEKTAKVTEEHRMDEKGADGSIRRQEAAADVIRCNMKKEETRDVHPAFFPP